MGWTASNKETGMKTSRDSREQIIAVLKQHRARFSAGDQRSDVLPGIAHVGIEPRGKACQNRSGLASRLPLAVGVGHLRNRGG